MKKDTTPLVTVAMVTYNSSPYIKMAIESVLNSSYENFELLISDDNSTDNTWEIIQSFTDSRIKTVRNEKNIGEYPNRNQCIEMARGEYLIFIDGDDVLLYRGIEYAVAEMERFKDCGMGVVRPENPRFIGPLRIQPYDILHLEYFGTSVLDSALCNNIYRTTTLKKFPFFCDYKNSDTYSRIRIAFYTDILVLIDPIAIWRQRPQQASRQITPLIKMIEQLSFFKNYLFLMNEKTAILPVSDIKTIYYKLFIRVFIKQLLRFSFFREWKQYKADDFTAIILHCFRKNRKAYWDEYNYTNLNYQFGK